jgi:ABC-2 type transport system permease protein
MWALYAREVKRFQKLWLDTVFNPIVSVGLYLAVFGVISGNRLVLGIPFLTFVYIGLLTMNVINASMSNPAFALIISKNVGTIVDLQLAPIAPWRIGIAYALAAATRAGVTLAVALLLTAWFIPMVPVAHPFLLLLALLGTALEFGLLGVAFGMWAKNFEALTVLMTFILQPMLFLAGVFYPISTLPAPWSAISAWNPVHHNINLVRYAATGAMDGNPWISVAVVACAIMIGLPAMHTVVQKKLRAV